MKSGNRSNALLVELLIVIMFFMLAATMLLQVFTAARGQSEQSGQMISVLNHAQDLMDQLYAHTDADQLLAGQGFQPESEHSWSRQDENGLITHVNMNESALEYGTMRYYTVSISDGTQALITLNGARYREAAL